MGTVDESGRLAVVVAGPEIVRSALASLFASWGWAITALAPDELAGVSALRRSRADLLVVHGSSGGRFGDLGHARAALAPGAIVRVVDVPQQLAADADSVLSGLPADELRRRLLAAVRAASSCVPV